MASETAVGLPSRPEDRILGRKIAEECRAPKVGVRDESIEPLGDKADGQVRVGRKVGQDMR